jgi:hypothetical protein
MMDALERYHGQLLYSFNLNEAAPEDHLVREIAAILDLSCLHGELGLGPIKFYGFPKGYKSDSKAWQEGLP